MLVPVLAFVFFVFVLLLVFVFSLVLLVLRRAGTQGVVTVYTGQHRLGWTGGTAPAVEGWRDARSLQV